MRAIQLAASFVVLLLTPAASSALRAIQDGSTTLEKQDKSITIRTKDGIIVKRNRQGAVLRKAPNGDIFQSTANGDAIHKKNGGHQTQVTENGTLLFLVDPDETSIQIDLQDFSVIIVNDEENYQIEVDMVRCQGPRKVEGCMLVPTWLVESIDAGAKARCIFRLA